MASALKKTARKTATGFANGGLSAHAFRVGAAKRPLQLRQSARLRTESRIEKNVKEQAVAPTTERLPFFAKVEVKQGKGIPARIVGRIGIVLGMSQLKNGQWNYSVFLGQESYSLPHRALKPTGEILKRSDIYGPDKLRVVVDEQGVGTIVNR